MSHTVFKTVYPLLLSLPPFSPSSALPCPPPLPTHSSQKQCASGQPHQRTSSRKPAVCLQVIRCVSKRGRAALCQNTPRGGGANNDITSTVPSAGLFPAAGSSQFSAIRAWWHGPAQDTLGCHIRAHTSAVFRRPLLRTPIRAEPETHWQNDVMAPQATKMISGARHETCFVESAATASD